MTAPVEIDPPAVDCGPVVVESPRLARLLLRILLKDRQRSVAQAEEAA